MTHVLDAPTEKSSTLGDTLAIARQVLDAARNAACSPQLQRAYCSVIDTAFLPLELALQQSSTSTAVEVRSLHNSISVILKEREAFTKDLQQITTEGGNSDTQTFIASHPRTTDLMETCNATCNNKRQNTEDISPTPNKRRIINEAALPFSKRRSALEEAPPTPKQDAEDTTFRDAINPSQQHHERLLDGSHYHHNSGLEADLDKLRQLRITDFKEPLYIPPLAKADNLAPDDQAIPLLERVLEFLESDRNVFLLLGESGMGKSTFARHLENLLWRAYKGNCAIPLLINLPAIDRPENDMVDKQLRAYDFSETEILQLKRHRRFVLICDGYDESRLSVNLYTANRLNQPGQWRAKMIITCRSTFLGNDYTNRFRPQSIDHYRHPVQDQFEEAVLVPFSNSHIREYVTQFVAAQDSQSMIGEQVFSVDEYMDKLGNIRNLMDLVRNPFLLTLALTALPSITGLPKDFTRVIASRSTLYDIFIRRWIDVSRRRLQKSNLNDQERQTFIALTDDNFQRSSINFMKELATAIYKHQGGNPIVIYSHQKDKDSWKAEFFGPKLETTILRESSPLTRSGIRHWFIHRSLLEYLFSLAVFDPDDDSDADPTEDQADSTLPPLSRVTFRNLSGMNLVSSEPSVVQFLAERVEQDSNFKEHLLAIVELSKTFSHANLAAANAITILVRSGFAFNGVDLRGVRIHGADLSGGVFDSADFQGADLSGVNLSRTWLRQANLNSTIMNGVRFGELPYITTESLVYCCAYSPDGKLMLTGLADGRIDIYDTSTWEKTRSILGPSGNIQALAFSRDGRKIAAGGQDGLVWLCDLATGKIEQVMRGPLGPVKAVTFSPTNDILASAGEDNTIRLWDTLRGSPLSVFRGHTQSISSVSYSPDGQRIVSASEDGTMRLWDVDSRELVRTWTGHTDILSDAAFSYSGRHIASASYDKTVRLWDTTSGSTIAILNGHTEAVRCIAYSPKDYYLATGSADGTVRLWNAISGAPGPVLVGHIGAVTHVEYSPSGHLITSVGMDKTIRLWDVHSIIIQRCPKGHTGAITKVSHSPNGQSFASASEDNTVRLWDSDLSIPGPVLTGHLDSVLTVQFSRDGKLVASGSKDTTIRLWDAASGETNQVFSGHTLSVTTVDFSFNGRWLASGSEDCTVKIWDIQGGDNLVSISDFFGAVSSISWRPTEGEFVFVTGSRDNAVRQWRMVEAVGKDKDSKDRYAVELIGSSSINLGLALTGAKIQGAVGLSDRDRRLFEQRGSIGVPLST